MTINITTPAAISVTATAGNAYSVSIGTPTTISVDATLPTIPIGGTTGQFLRKKSNTNYDAEWISGSVAGNWGDIGGTLSDQHDLQAVLDAHEDDINRMGSSGLLEGGELTISGDSLHFNVAAGVGVIIDNYTDPTNPVKTVVSWNDFTDVIPTYIADGTTSYVGIDINGAIVQWDENYYTDAERRDYIIIGWLDHVDYTYITDVFQEPPYPNDVYSQLMDFFENFGPFNVTGNEYSYHTLLQISRTAGKVFDAGANYDTARNNPNIIESDSEDACPIYYSYRSSSSPTIWYNTPTPTTDIDPNNYDTGTGLASVGAGKFTIQVLTYYAVWGSTDIQYGQVVYDTMAEAEAALTDIVELNPYNSGYDVFRAWLVVKQGATDLSVAADARFVSAGRLGLFASAAGGGTSSLANADNIGTTGEGVYHSVAGNTLEFKKIAAVAPIAIADITSGSYLQISGLSANSTRDGFLGSNDFQAFSGRAASNHSHGTVAGTNISITSASSGLSLSVGNYLTTAAASNHSHGNPTLSLTNISGTTASNSNGLTLSLSAGNYLTTAAASNHSHGNPTLALTNLSGTTASASNGLTISMSAGNYITTAMASNAGSNFVGLNSAVTNITATINSSGISISNPGWITTAAASNHSHGNPTLALTNLSGTTASASNGLTISLSANLGGGAGDGYNILAAGGSTAAQSATIVLSDSNGISFGLNGSTVTASHNGLTTAALSNHSHGNPTLALTNVAGTTASASNGLTLSLSISNYLTTAAASNHSHGNPTLSLTNISGTTASASNGFTLSLSAAAPGAGGGIALAGSNTTYTSGTVYISGNNLTVSSSLNGASQYIQLTAPAVSSLVGVAPISISSNGSTISISYTGITTAAQSDHSHGNPTLALTNLSGTTASASNGLTISLSAGAGGPGGGWTLSNYEPYPMHNTGTGIISAATGTSGSCTFIPFVLPAPVEFDFIKLIMSANFTTGGASAFTQFRTMSYGIYSRSDTSLNTLVYMTGNSMGLSCTYNNSSISVSQPTASNSAGFTYGLTNSAGLNISSAYTGLKLFALPLATTLQPGMYWLGLHNRQLTTGFNSGILLSHYGNSMTLTGMAPLGSYSASFSTGTGMALREAKFLPGFGVWTAAGLTSLPTSAAFSDMTGNVPVIPFMRLVIDD